MIVVKFGGTSVGDASAICRAAEIVRSRVRRQPIVVVSALLTVCGSPAEVLPPKLASPA